MNTSPDSHWPVSIEVCNPSKYRATTQIPSMNLSLVMYGPFCYTEWHNSFWATAMHDPCSGFGWSSVAWPLWIGSGYWHYDSYITNPWDCCWFLTKHDSYMHCLAALI